MDELKFYRTFERFITAVQERHKTSAMVDYTIYAEMCRFLGISKLVLKLYDSLQLEKIDKAVIHTLYESGSGNEKAIVSRRFLTSRPSVLLYEITPEIGVTWTLEDLDRIGFFVRMMYAFHSRASLEQIAEQFVYHDSDGNLNLRYMVREMDRLHAEGRLSKFSALFFNLKHFSLINRQIGRNNGTVVIMNFMRLFESKLKKDELICRVGGDNFAALILNENLPMILEMLKGTPVTYDTNKDEKVMVNATAGVFEIPDDTLFDGPDYVMDRVTSASQVARSGKEGDVVFYNEVMRVEKQKQLHVQEIFEDALKKEEFVVFYQPKVNLNDYTLSGAEALCRWRRVNKVIPPGEFIPVLEQSMSICDLDFYMIDHVCKDIRNWLDQGVKPVRVSINMSRKHLVNVDLLRDILSIIDANNVPHEYIEIELTETTTDVEFRDLKRVVNGLQAAGVYTSVDDFGIGYSSLNLIKEIPWNVLKVDKSFIPQENENETSGERRTIMFKYVVAMAQEMGLECIAEGIETRYQVKILRENNCDYAQGYFFDRPLPKDEFEKRLIIGHYDID